MCPGITLVRIRTPRPPIVATGNQTGLHTRIASRDGPSRQRAHLLVGPVHEQVPETVLVEGEDEYHVRTWKCTVATREAEEGTKKGGKEERAGGSVDADFVDWVDRVVDQAAAAEEEEGGGGGRSWRG